MGEVLDLQRSGFRRRSPSFETLQVPWHFKHSKEHSINLYEMVRYYDDSLNDEEARFPLWRSDSDLSGSGRDERRASKGNMNRILLIISLALLVIISLYFQYSQMRLSQQLSSDEEQLKKLQQTVKDQTLVINRFNSSVTNSDVVKRLTTLEYTLETNTKELHEELDRTIADVNYKLNSTMSSLEQTVEKAENEIASRVETVKKDYEEFERKTNDQFSMENSFMIWQLAGTFTLLSCLISSWHMGAHFRNLEQPIIQRKILAILWMSPIYAITSWVSLVFPQLEGYAAILKDSYEGYIIYQVSQLFSDLVRSDYHRRQMTDFASLLLLQFLSFCISVLGKGDRERVISLLAKRADHLSPPVSCRTLFFCCFCCCKPPRYESDEALARAVLMQCQKFAMQFVFWRPATTIAKVYLKKYDYYGPWGAEDEKDWRSIQFYIVLIQNISIFLAFTGLLKFYHAVDKDLAWCRPFAKFMCIKGVVFMTFWQGLAISLLATTLDETDGDPEEWATKSQNFLICLEMLLFSLAHYYCFPVNEWKPDYKVNYNNKLKFGDSVALGDFFSDLKLVMRRNNIKSLKQQKKKKPKKMTPTHPSTPILEEVDEEDVVEEDEGTYESEFGNDDASDDASLSTTFSNQTEKTVDVEVVNDAQERLTRFLDDMTFTRHDSEDANSEKSPLRPSVFTAVAEIAQRSGDVKTPKADNLVSENSRLLPTPGDPTIFNTLSNIDEQSSGEDEEQRYNC